jgi:MYXO-CTERM domain-containing protein
VGTIVVRTDIELGNATIRALDELMSEGTLRFTGDALCEIDDTPACQIGASAEKTGTGDIAFTGSTIFELMDGSTFTVENSGDFIGDSTALFTNDGLFIKQSAGLTLIDGVRFENTGTVSIEQGTLRITNPVLPFPSTLGPATYDIGDGAVLDLPNTSLATNQADVIFRGPDSAFSQFSSVSLNQGLVQAEGGADVFFTPTGGLANEGVLIADGASSTIRTGGAIDNNGGTITVLNGGVVAASNGFGPLNNNGGTVQGTGTIQSGMFNNNGTVSPGNSPGVLVSESAGVGTHIFQQGPAGTLAIEIGGRTAGVDHDVLDVRGIALFDGTLDLQFSPFVGEPQIMPGDQFQIILAEGIDGIFRDVRFSGLGSEAIIDVRFGSGAVVVVVEQVPAPGALAVLGLGGLIATRRRR